MKGLILAILIFASGFVSCLYALSFSNKHALSDPFSTWSALSEGRAETKAVESVKRGSRSSVTQRDPGTPFTQEEQDAIDREHPPIHATLSVEDEQALKAHWALHREAVLEEQQTPN